MVSVFSIIWGNSFISFVISAGLELCSFWISSINSVARSLVFLYSPSSFIPVVASALKHDLLLYIKAVVLLYSFRGLVFIPTSSILIFTI